MGNGTADAGPIGALRPCGGADCLRRARDGVVPGPHRLQRRARARLPHALRPRRVCALPRLVRRTGLFPRAPYAGFSSQVGADRASRPRAPGTLPSPCRTRPAVIRASTTASPPASDVACASSSSPSCDDVPSPVVVSDPRAFPCSPGCAGMMRALQASVPLALVRAPTCRADRRHRTRALSSPGSRGSARS